MTALGTWPVMVSYVPCEWFGSLVCIERMIASLSMCWATRGKISEIWMPSTLVEIGLNVLLGLGSQVSI